MPAKKGKINKDVSGDPCIALNSKDFPVFIDPRAEIGKDGKVENLAEFGSIENIFNMEKCQGCPALLDDNYGASRENHCLKCLDLITRIKKANLQDRA